jgi:hypothetical protein
MPLAALNLRVLFECAALVCSRPAKVAVKPYHTLLLLDSKDAILKALPVDALPQLRSLLTHCSPIKSFVQLQVP